MNPFRIQIADCIFQVHPMFSSTRDYCRKYWKEAPSVYDIVVSEEDLILEQYYLDQEARAEGIKLRKFSDPFLERSVVQRRIAKQLLERDVLMLHGSTVCVDGQAYLFTASCGTGKSTHTRLWREVFGDRAVMVNDDKPFLKICADGVVAYGSPWSGKHGLDSNICVPLKGICILRRGLENVIRRINPDDAVEILRNQSFVSENSEDLTDILLNQLMMLVPLWQMECTKDLQAACIAYNAMSK